MEERYRSIQRVLLVALAVNLVLAAGKMFLGWMLGSLSVLSDGVHSVLDGAGSVIGLVAIHVAALPPDPRHPYGHRKFEVLATLVLAGLLLLSCWEILGSAITRIARPSVAPDFSWGAVVFLLATIGINAWLSQYESRRGGELDSPLLTADAAHTRSDMFTTLLAIVGLFTARVGWPILDAVAAIFIVGIIGHAAYRIIVESVDTVADANRIDPAAIRGVAEGVSGVENAHDIRSHGMSNDIHIDLHLRVDKSMSARQVFDIEKQVVSELKTKFPGVTEVAIRHEPSDIGVDEDA
jgi:cation diffusion facilitator family transporter